MIQSKGVRGFTLIELLVVIAIIGLLSSVVLASLNNARSKSRDARRLSDIKQLQVALELHFSDENEYPTNLADLVTGDYIPVMPQDPTYEINYNYDSDGTDYCLGAGLENPKPNGSATCTLTCTNNDSECFKVAP